MSSQHPVITGIVRIMAASLAVLGADPRFNANQGTARSDSKAIVAGLHGLTLHDQCTGEFAAQPDTCLHQQLLERSVTVGGKPGEVHNVTLRIQGIVGLMRWIVRRFNQRRAAGRTPLA